MPFPPVRGLRLHDNIVSFEFQPTVGVLARDMDKLGMDIRSFREPLQRAVREVMAPSIRKNFDAEGRPGWEPLAEATLLMRDALGKSGPILNRTGLLKRTMSQLNVWTITEEYAIIKELPSKVWYGGVHQEGMSGMKTRLKAEVAKAAKRGVKISQGEAAKRAMQGLDRDVLAGKTKKSSTNIPARPFVMFQDEDYDLIEEVFQKWLGERAARAGWTGE